MTANELADELDKCSCVYYDSTTNQYFNDVELSSKTANMLRQQAHEINNLKRDLKWAREQWEKDRINLVHQMDGKDVEIENLKSKVQYWKGLHK
jgi:hypothetical protein